MSCFKSSSNVATIIISSYVSFSLLGLLPALSIGDIPDVERVEGHQTVTLITGQGVASVTLKHSTVVTIE